MSQALILDQKIKAQVQSERKITREILLTIQESILLSAIENWDIPLCGTVWSEV